MPVAKLETSKKTPQPVAQTDPQTILQQLAAKIPWGHNILLMEKVKDLTARPCHILTRALPESITSSLPSIEEIERELSEISPDSSTQNPRRKKTKP